MNENSSITKMSNDNYHSHSHPMSIDVSIRASNINSNQQIQFDSFQKQQFPQLKLSKNAKQDEGYSIEKKLMQRNQTQRDSKQIKNIRKFSIQEKSFNSMLKQGNNENQLPLSRDSLRENSIVIKEKLAVLEKLTLEIREGYKKIIDKPISPKSSNIQAGDSTSKSIRKPQKHFNQTGNSSVFQEIATPHDTNFEFNKKKQNQYEMARNIIYDDQEIQVTDNIYKYNAQDLPKIKIQQIKNNQFAKQHPQTCKNQNLSFHKMRKSIYQQYPNIIMEEENNQLYNVKDLYIKKKEYNQIQMKKLHEQIDKKQISQLKKNQMNELKNQYLLQNQITSIQNTEDYNKFCQQIMNQSPKQSKNHISANQKEKSQNIVSDFIGQQILDSNSNQQTINLQNQIKNDLSFNKQKDQTPDVLKAFSNQSFLTKQSENTKISNQEETNNSKQEQKKEKNLKQLTLKEKQHILQQYKQDLKFKQELYKEKKNLKKIQNGMGMEILEEDSKEYENLSLKIHKQSISPSKNKNYVSPLNKQKSVSPLLETQQIGEVTNNFSRLFPEYKTGLTPVKDYSESKLDPKDIDKLIEKRKGVQRIFRKQDFQRLNEKQRKFKDLIMNDDAKSFDEKSLIFPAVQSSKSIDENSQFPYAQKGQATWLQAYNSNKNSQAQTKDEQQLNGKVQAIKDEYIKKNQEKQKIAMDKFFDYLQYETIPKNIELIQNNLYDKVLQKGFENYQNLQDPTLKQFAKHIQEKSQFFNICKESQSPRALEQMRDDPQNIFFQACSKEVPTLSLMQKINNKALHLIGYNLNEPHCLAFRESCKLFPTCLNELLLDNNGLKDKSLALILEGLENLKSVKKFVCKNNELLKNSLCSLRQIILRPSPAHLEDLRLSNCKMTSQTTNDLLDFIISNNCQLKKLSLVKANLCIQNVNSLISLINNSKYLSELDISFNELGPASMKLISANLSVNKKLQYLNLSWNRLKEIKEVKQNIDQKEQQLDPDEAEITQNFCQFIKQNSKLLHLDLSHTGLTRLMLLEFGPALRRAKSLLVLHLSGNIGLDDEVINTLQERVHAAPDVEIIHLDLMNKKKKQQNNVLDSDHTALQEGLKIRRFIQEKNRKQDGRLPEFANTEENILILSRMILHKNEMPGSGQWKLLKKMIEKCWICNNNVHSLIFWNQKIGIIQMDQQDNFDYIIIEKIKDLQLKMENQFQKNPENFSHPSKYQIKLGKEGSSPGIPVIQGQFTNWHPYQMLPIEEYCFRIIKSKPDFIYQMILDGKCRQNIQNIDEMNDYEKKTYDQILQEYKKNIKLSWQSVMDNNQRYKNPNMINYEKIVTDGDEEESSQSFLDQDDKSYESDQENLDNIFVFPCYLKPGKHSYLVRYDPKSVKKINYIQDGSNSEASVDFDLQSQYYVHSHTAPFRTDDIPVKVKEYGTIKVENVFSKAKSVFKDWKEDNPERLAQCAEHDFSLWKLEKFVKNQDEREKIENVIRQNMQVLKTIQVFYASQSNYPHMLLLDYTQFLNKIKMTDQEVFKGLEFKGAVSNNQKDITGFQQDMMLRVNFLEAIVRVSIYFNKQKKLNLTESQALENFINNDIIPNTLDIVQEWDSFRQERLWKQEVHDLFKANLNLINKLMDTYHQPRQKFMSQQDILQAFSKDSEILLEKDAQYCYGMSKMPNQYETKDFSKHRMVVNQTEFLEMIARVAEFKYKGENDGNLSLCEKIELILDRLFMIIGAKTILPVEGEEKEDSQSDQDY